MYINKCNQYVLDENDALNILLSGSEINEIVTEDMSWVETFNSYSSLFELDKKIKASLPSSDKEKYINQCINNWNIPEEYSNIDVYDYIISLCSTQEEKDRVEYELTLYKEKELYNLLKFLIYFVDTLRKNKVLWGVGRGSSTSSYVLYLIGIHRVNSIKYDLDIGEFLK
jgi:DNA polymerase III alpha subunit